MSISGPRSLMFLIAAVALSASCSALDRGDIALRPHVRRTEPGLGTDSTLRRRPDAGSIGIDAPAGETLVRRVCRAAGWPANWIATAYETAPGECPVGTGPDTTARAAILVRLDLQPHGSTLDVCADQVVPRGWELVRLDGSEVSQRCPGAGRDGASAIRRIRRIS